MPDLINLNIETPTGPIRAGRGFYQLEEETLFVQIGTFTEKKHFFNYLENETIRFDIDREGHLIFIEISVAARHWNIIEPFPNPKRIEAADLKWLHFREPLPPASLYTNEDRTSLKISFMQPKDSFFYYLADAIIVETDSLNNVSAIWITDITTDQGGKKIAAFRKKNRIAKSYFL